MYESVDQIHLAKSRYRQLNNEAADHRKIKTAFGVDAGQQNRLLKNHISFLKRLFRIRTIRIKISIETKDPCPEAVG